MFDYDCDEQYTRHIDDNMFYSNTQHVIIYMQSIS